MLFLLFTVLSTVLSFASDQIIVTATRENSSTHDLPFSVGTISKEDWQNKEPESALANISGLAFTNNGGPGQTRGVLLRGAKSEHLLVLVDGIIVNDPLSPSRGFDFGQIPAQDIERVEIIKGPQSVLFGSDAMGGVIQIFTNRKVNPPKIQLEGGSYKTGKAAFSAYGFHAGFEQSAGFSAADSRNGNSEADGHRVLRTGGVKDYDLNERTTMRNTALFSDSKTDTDAGGGIGGDSKNTFARNNRLQFRSELAHVFENGVDGNIAGSVNIVDREDNTLGPTFYKSNLWKVESLWHKALGKHDLIYGAEYSRETGRSTDLPQQKSLHSYGTFAQDHFINGRFHASLGARIDFPSEQGNPQTYRTGFGYWLIPDQIKIKTSLGTGFKSPSLYQTYSSYGTRRLAPEKSLGGDLGMEILFDHFETEILWYQNRFKNMIDFDSASSKYYNIGLAETYGIEWTTIFQWGPWRLQNAFTTTHAMDKNTRQSLLRRPRWNNTLAATWKDGSYWTIASQARLVGPREDLHPNLFTRQNMPTFLVIGANARRKITEKAAATLRVDNLLHRNYQETSGYGTAGFSAYAGLELEM